MSKRPYMTDPAPWFRRSFDEVPEMNKMNYRNPIYTPENKQRWEIDDGNLHIEFTTHKLAGWLDISMTESYHTGKRQMTRTISETMSREHAVKLAHFILEQCEEKTDDE